MYAKLSKFWRSLDRNVVVNKRELFLGMTSCALSGILLGMLLSPRHSLTIASYNTGAASSEKASGKQPHTSATGEEGEKSHARCPDKGNLRIRHH